MKLIEVKPVIWLGSSKKDLRAMPEHVKDDVGFALFVAQKGAKHPDAKVLKGFGSGGILEVVEQDSGGTYRAVYTVQFASAIYVLHCFKKKSKQGIATPRQDLDLIRDRFKEAVRWGEGEVGMKKMSPKPNIYADLGIRDADAMQVKAELAFDIGAIIRRRKLSQTKAAELMELPQPKLSGLLRGRFRGISESKMMDCLTRLGASVSIVVQYGGEERREHPVLAAPLG